MMYSGGSLFGFFWIFPFLGFAAFLVMMFLRGRHSSSSHRDSHYFEKKHTKVQREIPAEMLKAGRDVLDNLDWEIRLLEKQRLDANSSKEKEKIELELKGKKADYRAVIERLEQ